MTRRLSASAMKILSSSISSLFLPFTAAYRCYPLSSSSSSLVATTSFSRSISVIDVVCRSRISPPSYYSRCAPLLQKMMSTDSMPPPSSQLENNEEVGLSDIGQQQSSGYYRRKDNNSNNSSSDDDYTTRKGWKERIDISIAKSRKIRGSNYVQLSTIDIAAMEPRCRTVVFRGFLKNVPDYQVRNVPPTAAEYATLQFQNSDDDYGKSYGDCVMKMITDKRSGKVHEATSENTTTTTTTTKTNVAEMVWWFAKSNEQYRVRGKLRFIGANVDTTTITKERQEEEGEGKMNDYFTIERKQQWGNLSDMAREQFYWNDPGLVYEGQPSSIPQGGRDIDGTVLPPPDNFLLMLLYPTRVDYLRLTDNYHQIDEWRKNEQEEEQEEGKSKIMMIQKDDGSAVYSWESMRVNP